MVYKINPKACLKCGICVSKCPEKAIRDKPFEDQELSLHVTSIDPKKCTDCGVCVYEEYWCPAQAIYKA